MFWRDFARDLSSDECAAVKRRDGARSGAARSVCAGRGCSRARRSVRAVACGQMKIAFEEPDEPHGYQPFPGLPASQGSEPVNDEFHFLIR